MTSITVNTGFIKDRVSTQATPARASTPGLIEQTLRINVNQASPRKASTPDLTRQNFYTRSHRAELPHRRQSSLIRQSLHTDASRSSLLRASTPTPTRSHRAEPPRQYNQASLELRLYINANQTWSTSDKKIIKFTILLDTFYVVVYYSILGLRWSEEYFWIHQTFVFPSALPSGNIATPCAVSMQRKVDRV